MAINRVQVQLSSELQLPTTVFLASSGAMSIGVDVPDIAKITRKDQVRLALHAARIAYATYAQPTDLKTISVRLVNRESFCGARPPRDRTRRTDRR
jgi:hypothetical protein